MGPLTNQFIRYPDDQYDRLWEPFETPPIWTAIATNSTIQQPAGDVYFQPPNAVMRTAATPAIGNRMNFSWTATTDPTGRRRYSHFNLYLAEFDPLSARRDFPNPRVINIDVNGAFWYGPIYLDYMLASCFYTGSPWEIYSYNLSMVTTNDSILPPMLNALEVFSVMFIQDNQTAAADVDAITAVKVQYQLKRNWMGDPCVPKSFSWDGLNCMYKGTDRPKIITLNLSSSGLTGKISSAFGNLKAITYLDLSNNNLIGEIPHFLAELPSLNFLDLTGNHFNGSVPSALLEKADKGLLTLSIDKTQNQCITEGSCETQTKKNKKNNTTRIAVIVPVVSVGLLLVVTFFVVRSRWHQGLKSIALWKPQGKFYSGDTENNSDKPVESENRRFTYKELEMMTKHFKQEIGRGGFGSVYHGYLENGDQVAVKMHSESSLQGTKEFLAEAQLLSRVHHRNLVSLVGYCKDGNYLALIYEYMSQGTLQKHLKGVGSSSNFLTWGVRLQIALEAAQGLEYLHKGCRPPIIHRDVKTSNILLNERLEAKIADFGLSKAYSNEFHTHISTAVAGTPGYLDPEYYNTLQLNEKSDVYSFGVVLLELITGQPAIITSPENGHIIPWVSSRLSTGEIKGIVDKNMQGGYDVNSMWKIADIAMKCTLQLTIERATMEEVVIQLKESLALEMARITAQGHHNKVVNTRSTNSLEATYIENTSVTGGPAAR